jgi:hypothetical protein
MYHLKSRQPQPQRMLMRHIVVMVKLLNREKQIVRIDPLQSNYKKFN